MESSFTVDGTVSAAISEAPAEFGQVPLVFGTPWPPVPALGTAAQERLAAELLLVLRVWTARIRPALWRNLRGEPYPAGRVAGALPSRR